MIAYKLFRIKDGKLYPLYVDTKTEIKQGTWLTAKEGPKTESGKVKSALGELSYRPGFHITEVPYAGHIGKKMKSGELCQRANSVWCEVEMPDTDITEQVHADNKKCLKELPPEGTYYRFNTNASATVDWFIASQMKVLRILNSSEVKKICTEHGIQAQVTEEEYIRSTRIMKEA